MGAVEDPTMVRGLAAQVLKRVDDLADRFVTLMITAEPVYAERYSREEIARACERNTRLMLEALATVEGDVDTSSAVVTGRRNAEQGVPLEALLHLYRMAARMIWDELVEEAGREGSWAKEQLLDGAAEVWNLMDRMSALVAESYHRTEAALARRDQEQRAHVLEAVLSGRTADPEVLRDVRAVLHFSDADTFRVVAVSVDDAPPPAARDLETALGSRGVDSAWRRSQDLFLGVVAIAADDLSLEGLLTQVLSGRVGCSPPCRGIAGVPAAAELAQLARRTLNEPGVAMLEERLTDALLVRNPDLAERLVGRVFGDVASWDADADTLLETFEAWCAAGGRAPAAAAGLYCHRNTVFNRLRRLQDVTGKRLDQPGELAELWIAARALRLLGPP